jgi:peptide subunit release factor 1 (eRF1)
MLTENELRELVEYTSPDWVLSIYLNTDPTEGNADAYRLSLRNLLKKVTLPQDVAVIERFFATEYDWSGRGIALFSCAPQGFFRAYPLAIPVRNRVFVSNRPSVRPLADLLDSYGGYGVVLVDQQGARLFFFHLGELREQEGTVGEAIRRVKNGGASAMPGRRGGTSGQTHFVEETVERNMKETAEFAVRFFEENRVRRVLIGGTEANVASLRNALPKAWQSLIVGSFAMPMTASHNEVLQRAMQIGREVEIETEERLVEDMITIAAKGGQAVTGLENSLDAINAGRVKTLVIAEGFAKSGYHCPICGMLKLTREECDECGHPERVADIVDLAVSTVMRQGGDVEVVHGSEILERAGHIGAFLRY